MCSFAASKQARRKPARSRDLFVALRDAPGAAVTSELTLAELLAPVKRPDALSLASKQDLYGCVLPWGGFIELRPVDRHSDRYRKLETCILSTVARCDSRGDSPRGGMHLLHVER